MRVKFNSKSRSKGSCDMAGELAPDLDYFSGVDGSPWYISGETALALQCVSSCANQSVAVRWWYIRRSTSEKTTRTPGQRVHVGARWPALESIPRQTDLGARTKVDPWQSAIQRLQQINRQPRAAIPISHPMMCPNRRPASRRKSPSTKTKAVMATSATTTSRAPKELLHRIRFSNDALIALM
jgi:hypothetical protein